ncbi:U2 snRNP complex subunit LEA1 Ecym_2186 [Eremothecium cymbalariae DBVPG|uniref:U2 small nuclear ribonucleoprotein A' n=1 Tax=Eremothecium cymbalariae (strain CBS 270.75 / DBVPG 7215 / KCTC 17166 / NRRL Y-17582) TaxID=931890 RepID=G8JP30_ERECY|nr:Hypothetical protein Ecym_2186 [Eremothecium cymbalariae DBVPG\
MKLTHAGILEAPVYYVDHFHKKYDIDRVVILRDKSIVNDHEVMPETLKILPDSTNVLDFTHNNLNEFPPLGDHLSIHTLLLSRNQINKLNGSRLPKNLKNLVLAMNRIDSPEQLYGLKSSPKSLENLNLRGNIVCHLAGYRELVISLCPGLKVLDGERITLSERKCVTSVTPSGRQPAGLVSKVLRSDEKEIQLMDHVFNKLDASTKEKVKQLLSQATTLAEVESLEKLLSGGV